MQFALISTNGDVLEWFDDLDAAYAAADETEDADLVAFGPTGLPQPPPARTYHFGTTEKPQQLSYSGEVETVQAPGKLAVPV